MRRALITSFQRAHGLAQHIPVYSAAVYQPKGSALPKAAWADIRSDTLSPADPGKWIRPREFLDFPDPLAAYHQALLSHYERRHFEIALWLDMQPQEFALCCWCPYERAAQRQIEEHGSYVCHTAVVGEVLEQLGVQVFYDSDRQQQMKVLP